MSDKLYTQRLNKVNELRQLGVNLLVMLLTESDSIRDVILFPPMRPEIKG